MGTKKTHADGSVTHTNNSGESTTYDRDGSIRERTSHDLAFGFGKKVTITRDGDGNEINRQDGWGKK